MLGSLFEILPKQLWMSALKHVLNALKLQSSVEYLWWIGTITLTMLYLHSLVNFSLQFQSLHVFVVSPLVNRKQRRHCLFDARGCTQLAASPFCCSTVYVTLDWRTWGLILVQLFKGFSSRFDVKYIKTTGWLQICFEECPCRSVRCRSFRQPLGSCFRLVWVRVPQGSTKRLIQRISMGQCGTYKLSLYSRVQAEACCHKMWVMNTSFFCVCMCPANFLFSCCAATHPCLCWTFTGSEGTSEKTPRGLGIYTSWRAVKTSSITCRQVLICLKTFVTVHLNIKSHKHSTIL